MSRQRRSTNCVSGHGNTVPADPDQLPADANAVRSGWQRNPVPCSDDALPSADYDLPGAADAMSGGEHAMSDRRECCDDVPADGHVLPAATDYMRRFHDGDAVSCA